MKTYRRTSLSRIMCDAWNLARQGAQKFGGSVSLYFALSLHLTWQDARQHPVTVWHRGLGNQFLMPGLSLPTLTSKGQVLLPGMGR